MPEFRLSGAAMALDYYDILGVPPKSDAGEIRKAYRLLALKWHPDRNPADPRAANRFLQVGEAYRVLRDPVSRTAYDRLRSQEKLRGKDLSASSSGSGRGPEPPSQESSARQWRRSAGPGGNPARGGSGRLRKKRPAPPASPHHGASNGRRRGLATWLRACKDIPHRFLDWLNSRPPTALKWEMLPTPGRPDLAMVMRLPAWLAARGTRVNLVIKGTGQRRRLKIAIPPGVRDGRCLVVKGVGKGTGAERGHLYITIRVQDRPPQD